jgi:hypothetical protein
VELLEVPVAPELPEVERVALPEEPELPELIELPLPLSVEHAAAESASAAPTISDTRLIMIKSFRLNVEQRSV